MSPAIDFDAKEDADVVVVVSVVNPDDVDSDLAELIPGHKSLTSEEHLPN